MSALALLSGGLDSTVAAVLHRETAGRVDLGLFVDYGQRAAVPEARAAGAVARFLGCELLRVELPLLATETRTALVSRGVELPHPDPGRLDEAASAAAGADAVWVPNRNGLLVNLAAAVAEARGMSCVIVGFNAEEGRSFPDNSARFLRHLNLCLEDSTRGRVTVVSPTLELTKERIWAAGRAHAAPLEATWSCYEGGEQPCGRCESCCRVERARRSAGG